MAVKDLSRRGVIGAASLPLVAGAATAAELHPQSERVLTRIAFGSCADSAKPQPIWDAIVAAEPDLFIFLGDNIYADTRDPAVMRAKYAELAAKPGFQHLRERVPIVATWDDHDYGENDAGRDYPMKEEARRQFLNFFGTPQSSPRWTRDGIYTSYTFGSRGRRTQIILPDLRWNRTDLRTLELGGQDYEQWAERRAHQNLVVPGPYDRDPDSQATQLGARQWEWLEATLAEPADFRVLASSLQVVADFPGWEAWINFAHEHQRLIQAIRDKRANHLICISGDTHYGELSRLDVNTPYPLWDVTSSGLTEVWPVLPPNARRVGEAYRDQNFGLLTLNWAGARSHVTMQIRDAAGAVRVEQTIALRDLTV